MTPHMISAAALALAVMASGTAYAQEAAMTVRVGDLNMQGDAGAAIALRRIKVAATSFCGGAGARELWAIAAQRDCLGRMTDKAVLALDAPKVTALNGASRSSMVLASVH